MNSIFRVVRQWPMLGLLAAVSGFLAAPESLAADPFEMEWREFADLATPSGADTLKARVREAAKSACTDLDRLYPAGAPERNCALKAADEAMSQVNAAIAAAQKK